MSKYICILLFLTGCAHEHFFEADAGLESDGNVDQFIIEDTDSVPPAQDVGWDSSLVDELDHDFEDAAAAADAAVDALTDMDVVDMSALADAGLDEGLSPEVDMLVIPEADAALPMDQGITESPSTGYTLCGTGMEDRVGEGTWSDPIQIGRFPFVDRASTAAMGQPLANRYDCAENTNEAGPEIVYRFSLEGRGDLIAQVIDSQGTDIDLHLLSEADVENGVARGCLGRAHRRLEVPDLEPGDYLLVADSWSNAEGEIFDGAFEIAVDVFEVRRWLDVPLADGITWSRYQGPVEGAWQTVNVLKVAPSAMERMIIDNHGQCETVEDVARANQYLAGVNGGFFRPGCFAKGFLRVNDATLSYSAAATSDPPLENEARVGWRGESIWFFWREAGSEWTLPQYALGLHPMLVQDGEARAEVQEGQEVYSAVDWTPQPRTALGHDEDGNVLLLTLDGRTNAGAGMTTPAFASWLDETFSLRSAINLDGGGSTTFVVNGCWVGPNMGDSGLRVFNSPSGNGEPNEFGSRPVGNGVYLQ